MPGRSPHKQDPPQQHNHSIPTSRLFPRCTAAPSTWPRTPTSASRPLIGATARTRRTGGSAGTGTQETRTGAGCRAQSPGECWDGDFDVSTRCSHRMLSVGPVLGCCRDPGPFLTHLWVLCALWLPPCRLRSWTSCSSTPYTSQHERSCSPAALTSTYSLDTMPKFAFSSEDESPCVAPAKPERPKFVLGDPDTGASTAVKTSALSGAWVFGADRVPNGVVWLLHALLNPVEGPKGPSTAILPPPSSSLSADLVSLNRIRLRSNSTGTKNSAPRGLEPGSSRRLSSQKDGTEKPRTSPGSRVPKSASVSALSLIITSGSSLASAAAAAAAWLPGHEPPSCPCR